MSRLSLFSLALVIGAAVWLPPAASRHSVRATARSEEATHASVEGVTHPAVEEATRVGAPVRAPASEPLPSAGVAAPGLRPEFCEMVVTGRSAAGAGSFPWHEAMLPGFRNPLAIPAPSSDAASPEGILLGESPVTPPAPAASPREGPVSSSTLPASPGKGFPATPSVEDGRAPRLDDGAASSPERRGRSLVLAGRFAEAWQVLRGLAPDPGSELAFVRAWAAGKSGAREAPDLLRSFTGPTQPLACRAPAARAAARGLAERGETGAALALLSSLRSNLPQIADHVLAWSLEAGARSGDVARVETIYEELRSLQPPRHVLRNADLALAQLYERAGQVARARSLLVTLLPQVPRQQRPALLLELADLESRVGETDAAVSRLRRIVEDHPESQQAAALVEPTFVEGRPRVRFTSRDRAVVLASHGLAREALEALTPTTDPDLLRLRGDIRLRNGRYLEAAADYAEAIRRGGDREELRMELAKAYGRAGESARARGVYRAVYATAGGRPEGAMAAYLIADAFQDEAARAPGLADSAAAWFRVLVNRQPSARLAPRGLMRLAHLRFARGDQAAARDLYREYLRRYPGGEDAREARYWLARTVQEDARAEEARALLRELLQPGASDYYALLARRRLGGAAGSPLDDLFDRGPAEPAAETAQLASADTVIPAGSPGERALRRARALRLVGEVEAAQREIDEAVRLSGGSRAELQRVARWALAFGYPESAFRIGAALPSAGEAAGELPRLAYPRAFENYVRLEAAETGLPTGLLWAIMRQESRFDPAVRSPAGAVGLLQLMPATGRSEASRAGLESFDVRDLERPEANLHLGAIHLQALADSVGEETVAAIAAYNAGRALASRWRAFPEASSPEGYVERIPFRETRNYVKQVIAGYARYQELYGTR